MWQYIGSVGDSVGEGSCRSTPVGPCVLETLPPLPSLPSPALAHRVSRPRGTGSVGDSVGEGLALDLSLMDHEVACAFVVLELALDLSLSHHASEQER